MISDIEEGNSDSRGGIFNCVHLFLKSFGIHRECDIPKFDIKEIRVYQLLSYYLNKTNFNSVNKKR